jgi:hypothetical protein
MEDIEGSCWGWARILLISGSVEILFFRYILA